MKKPPSPSMPAGFDPVLYARAYPDVALSGLDPCTHYHKYGKLLGRLPAGGGQAAAAGGGGDPALLDLRYAEGVIPADGPRRHAGLVSIIIPCCNSGRWLRRAIHSALSQAGVEVEVIVVDDGSTDGSAALARQLAAAFPNLHVHALLRHFGYGYALNYGWMRASGAYATVLGGADIMAPGRIARQLDLLKDTPDAVACAGLQRRWTPGFEEPAGGLEEGGDSLLWRREAAGRAGWPGPACSGGAGRQRLQQIYGAEAVPVLDAELYFARAPDGAPGTAARAPAAARPQAAPAAGQRRVGAMASFPPRRGSLEAALPRILPQLDELILYLNGYSEIPDFARDPRIRAVLGAGAAGDLRDNGKFYDLPAGGDAYVFTLDDDLLYPPDYTARMIHHIEMLGRACVVGVHGVIFPEGGFERLDQRQVFHFANPHRGRFADLLGTGTAAWHSSALQPELAEFPTKGICDLWFAAAAAKRGVPLFSVPRERNWLQEQQRSGQSLYREALDQPEGYFSAYRSAVAPVLQNGRLRRQMEAQLAWGFDAGTLAAAGIAVPGAAGPDAPARQAHVLRPPASGPEVPPAAGAPGQPLHLHLVVTGWNCRGAVPACLRAIATQLPGPYRCDVTLVDDGSCDGTFEELERSALLPAARLVRLASRSGGGQAWLAGIAAARDPDTIVVLASMEDGLEPGALRSIARCWLDHPDCLMVVSRPDETGPRPLRARPEEMDMQEAWLGGSPGGSCLLSFRRRLCGAGEGLDLPV